MTPLHPSLMATACGGDQGGMLMIDDGSRNPGGGVGMTQDPIMMGDIGH